MQTRLPAPKIAWLYGLLGLIPFVVGAAGALGGRGALQGYAQAGLLVYAGLILSFLGGGRWGLEIGRAPVRAAEISASMAPTVVAFLILMAPMLGRWRFFAMAAAIFGQWLWDVRSDRVPPWYPTLRSVLTAAAMTALTLGFFAQPAAA